MSPDDFVGRIQSRIELARHPLVSASVVHDQHGEFVGYVHERRIHQLAAVVKNYFKDFAGKEKT